MMKRENIKVGEWVLYKDEAQLAKVNHIDIDGMVYAEGHNLLIVNCPPSHFRYPRICDLKIGDVFERKGVCEIVFYACNNLVQTKRVNDAYNRRYSGDQLSERIRIISLVEEKLEPRSGVIDDVFFNIYSKGKPSRHNSRVGADNFADSATKERIACVKVSINWQEGQFDE